MNNILQNHLLGMQISRVYLDKRKELEDIRNFLINELLLQIDRNVKKQ